MGRYENSILDIQLPKCCVGEIKGEGEVVYFPELGAQGRTGSTSTGKQGDLEVTSEERSGLRRGAKNAGRVVERARKKKDLGGASGSVISRFLRRRRRCLTDVRKEVECQQ